MIIFLFIINLIFTNLTEDLVQNPPGFSTDYKGKVYSGFLNISGQPTNLLHYVFLTSMSQNKLDPIILWLNGGPGCSSLIGFLTQIGPFLIQNQYKQGDNLLSNKYTWNQNAHLLFIQLPNGVGFSIGNKTQYNDSDTVKDCYSAIKYFFTQKASQYKGNKFYVIKNNQLAGQGYAGIYIPELTYLISKDKQQQLFDYKGFLIGNGIMTINYAQIYHTQKIYRNNFYSQQIAQRFLTSCQIFHLLSPRCKFFFLQTQIIDLSLNLQNLYDVCTKETKANGFPICKTQQSLISYINKNKQAYNIHSEINWKPCVNYFQQIKLNYTIQNQFNTIEKYITILKQQKYHVLLFNGDWDSYVPFQHILGNIKRFFYIPQNQTQYQPWFVNNQHAGFSKKLTSKFELLTIKGGSHRVPESKPEIAYDFFTRFLLKSDEKQIYY